MNKTMMLAILACLLALSLSNTPVAEAQTTLKTGEISGLTVISNTDKCGGDVPCKTVYQDCGAWTDDKQYQITLKDESAKTTTDKITDLKTTIKTGGDYCKTITVEGKKSPFTNVDNQLCKDGICDARFAWWNSTYPFRQCFNVNVSSGTLTNYQVLLNVTFDPAMQSNFQDLRFTASESNATEIDYWLPYWVASLWTDVWVEVPTINSTPCMYYGNPSVTTTSNGFNTFLIFDDFQDGDYSSLTSWTATGHETGTCTYSVNSFGGSNVMNITAVTPGTADACAKKAGTIPLRPYIIESDFYTEWDDGVDYYTIRVGTTESANTWVLWNYAEVDDDIDVSSIIGGAFKGWLVVTGTSNPLMTQDAWYHTKILKNESATRGTVYLSSGKHNYIMNYQGSQNSADHDVNGSVFIECNRDARCYFDDVFVREYNIPDPTYSFGAEEGYATIDINITSPLNATACNYGCIYLNVSANDTVSKWYYDYNGTNTTFTPNTTLCLTPGFYSLTVWGNDSVNKWWSEVVNFTVCAASIDINITSPTNTSCLYGCVDLDVSVNDSIGTWFYDYNGTNTTFTPNYTSLCLPLGSYSMTVWGNDSYGVWWSDMVNFSICVNSTLITITEPTNASCYDAGAIPLNVSANSSIGTWFYNYNGTNITFTPNTTITLPMGSYSITVWGNDSNNTWWSDMVNITVCQPPVYIENCTADVMALCENDDYFLGFWGPEWSSGVCSGNTLYLSRNCSSSWNVGNITYYCNWDKTETKLCSNGCYDLLTYYGAGCAPTEFEITIYGIIIFIALLGSVLWIRRRA